MIISFSIQKSSYETLSGTACINVLWSLLQCNMLVKMLDISCLSTSKLQVRQSMFLQACFYITCGYFVVYLLLKDRMNFWLSALWLPMRFFQWYIWETHIIMSKNNYIHVPLSTDIINFRGVMDGKSEFSFNRLFVIFCHQ